VEYQQHTIITKRMLQIAWSIITTITEKTAQCTISQIASILGAEKQSS